MGDAGAMGVSAGVNGGAVTGMSVLNTSVISVALVVIVLSFALVFYYRRVAVHARAAKLVAGAPHVATTDTKVTTTKMDVQRINPMQVIDAKVTKIEVHNITPMQVGGAVSAPTPLPVWLRVADHECVWFKHSGSGEVVWTLPEGEAALDYNVAWLVRHDDECSWFENYATGVSVWELPEGGILVESPPVAVE